MTRTCDLRFRKKPRTSKGPRITLVLRSDRAKCPERASMRLLPSGGVAIELVFAHSLRKKRNIRGHGRRLSAKIMSRAARESRDEFECVKSRDFRPTLASPGQPSR